MIIHGNPVVTFQGDILFKSVTSCNPILPNINSLIYKYLLLLYADLEGKKPQGSVSTILLILQLLIAKWIHANMPMSLITSDKSKDEYITSAVDFKPRFRIHKGEIKTKIKLCSTSRHVNEKHQKHQNSFWICQSSNFWTFYGSEEPSKTEEVLWYGERYWQSQLFTGTYWTNSINDLNIKKRKGYRK